MIAYCNKYSELSNYKLESLEFEVLNELKDLSNRSDANCLYHTRFLFEMDYLPLKEQCELAETIKNKLVRVVYSGSKSLHCIVEFDKQYEDQCKQYYKEIWQTINEDLFGGNCDSQCVNPARLTRTPDVIRHDTGKRQTLIYDMPANAFPDASKVISRSIRLSNTNNARMAVNAIRMQYLPRKTTTSNHKPVDPMEWVPVKHYLETSYPKVKGNGDSSQSLFKALRVCIKYNKTDVMQKILEKAKNEHWSDKELTRMIENIGTKYV